MRRHVDSLGRPPFPVIVATLIGWGLIGWIVLGEIAPFVHHVVREITTALGG